MCALNPTDVISVSCVTEAAGAGGPTALVPREHRTLRSSASRRPAGCVAETVFGGSAFFRLWRGIASRTSPAGRFNCPVYKLLVLILYISHHVAFPPLTLRRSMEILDQHCPVGLPGIMEMSFIYAV